MQQKSFAAKPGDIARPYYIIDAQNKILGKVAVKAADILRGKNKATFSPNVDTGGFVIVINADKVVVSGTKLKDKWYMRYSGYPSGFRIVTLDNMLKNRPKTAIKLAVHGMIPHGRLGSRIRTKLKIYSGDKHPHQAQKPIPVEV